MTNRKSRRAVAAVSAKPPAMKNISGTDECCRVCKNTANQAALAANNKTMNVPPLDDTHVVCLANPGGGVIMKTFGWCAKFRP